MWADACSVGGGVSLRATSARFELFAVRGGPSPHVVNLLIGECIVVGGARVELFHERTVGVSVGFSLYVYEYSAS